MGTNLAKYGRSEKKSSEEEEEVDDSQTTAINSSSSENGGPRISPLPLRPFSRQMSVCLFFCLLVLLKRDEQKGRAEKKEFVPDLFMTQEKRR